MLFMNKSLTSAYLKRKKFGNLYRENKTDSSSIACIMKRNYLTKTKKDHYMNFDEKYVTDNKQFWRTVQPLLSHKMKTSVKIALVEREELIN